MISLYRLARAHYNDQFILVKPKADRMDDMISTIRSAGVPNIWAERNEDLWLSIQRDEIIRLDEAPFGYSDRVTFVFDRSAFNKASHFRKTVETIKNLKRQDHFIIVLNLQEGDREWITWFFHTDSYEFSKDYYRATIDHSGNIGMKLGLVNPPGIQESRVLHWMHGRDLKDDHEELKYAKDPVVIDLGAYKGEWAESIRRKYPNTFIHMIEPVPTFAQLCKKKFEGDDKAMVHQMALGGKTGRLHLNLMDDGSSFHHGENTARIPVTVKEFSRFLKDQKLRKVTLLKMNIEGSEFGILEHILNRGIQKSIQEMHIQFHTFAPNARVRRLRIVKELLKTHRATYSFPFVWENYRLK